MDITRKIRIIENLKSELLNELALLYKSLCGHVKEERMKHTAEALSNMVIMCYILGRRLGISYDIIETSINSKIKLGLIEELDVEKYYRDLSELAEHLGISRASR